ncbi:putative psoralen synthase [Rosa chinensis]|uniref:Putative psoralen synthase n=1 Tax=Rosa chinensis TaxID=74649 RepID=A0A2P6P5G1_ROSCH|nr:putative psoralen synthase [Rosa chinensis]
MSSYLSSSMVLLLLVFLIPFIFLLLMKQNARGKWLPSGPRRLPLIGNLHHLYDDLTHSVLQHLSSQYGPNMFMQLGSRPTLVISSAEMATEVLKTHDLVFQVRKIVILELLGPKRVPMFQSVMHLLLLNIQELLKESMVLLGGLYVSDFLPRISWINKFSGLEQRDMFLAGTDTTSAVLVWTMAELMRNPLVLKKHKMR